jgi:hypothetical protein
MKLRSITLVLAFFAMLFNSPLPAQSISRSSGIGFRGSYWNMADHTTRFSVRGGGEQVSLDIGGVGGWLYFFSRLHDNWFFDFNLGAISRVRVEETGFTSSNTDVSVIIPFLFGLRCDLLSLKYSSAFQPYLTFGGGPYLTTAVVVHDQFTGEEVTGESQMKFGAYAGGGTNIVLRSWVALNFDVKYHFVDFQASKNESGLDFGLGFSFMWGRKREIFQIKETKVVVRDIYPAYYQFYNTYPLALVTVKNVAGYPIDVNVRGYVKGYSVRPKDSGFVRLARGETRDVPVTAIFGANLRETSRRTPAVLDLEVEARAGSTHRQEVSAEIIVHNRNAWNGEMDKLGFFVTSDDEEVLRLSRKLSQQKQDEDSTGAGNLPAAQAIFDGLRKMNLQYHRDPNIPFYQDDRVQFATETIDLRHGDCDDLVVLYASLLESLGINTAFVEVKDPEKEMAHLYLLFDSGLAASEAFRVSSNEKRYVVREDARGKSKVWIPLETTLVASGFEAAWKTGALEYLQDGVVRNGLGENWVKIIDVE